jgi:hypothetical protein
MFTSNHEDFRSPRPQSSLPSNRPSISTSHSSHQESTSVSFHGTYVSLCFHTLTHSFASAIFSTPFSSISCALFRKNTRVGYGSSRMPSLCVSSRAKEPRIPTRSGAISFSHFVASQGTDHGPRFFATHYSPPTTHSLLCYNTGSATGETHADT